MTEGREIVFMVRACPPTENYPQGLKQEMMAAHYEPHELAFLHDLQTILTDSAPGERRRQALNSVHVIHELKALLGARIEEEGA